jgi:hypothetical protein
MLEDSDPVESFRSVWWVMVMRSSTAR